MVTHQVCQETAKKATISPLFEPELAEIRAKLTEWDQRFGPGLVAVWLVDIALNQVYQTQGFDYTNALITQARKALKRSEGNASLDRRRRIKKQATAEKSLQNLAEVA